MKMDVIKTICSVAIYFILFTSCHKASPAGFWLDFRKNQIVKSISDQGPYGGKRAIFWKAGNDKNFSPQEFIEFARKNGWQLTDSIFIPFDSLKRWIVNNTFPFTYSQFSDSSVNPTGLPRWIESDIELYRFESGWIAIEPGNARETNKNGYIVFSSDRSEVALYHLWGE